MLTISMVTLESLMVLENNLVAAKYINREYDDQFAQEGAKIGDTLNIRKPPRYLGRTGQALGVEDATETSVPLVLSTQRGVDIAFTTKDLTLSIDEFSKRFLDPAIASVANHIDFDVLGLWPNVWNQVGTPGTVPADLNIYLSASQKMSESSAPRDNNRSMLITPGMEASIIYALKGLFQSAADIAEQYEKGQMGKVIGFKWSMDQNCGTQTVGPLGGTPLVNGASQTGSSLATKGWTAAAASRLNVGDVFTIAGVHSVNPQSRQSTGSLQNFVVTAAFFSDASGDGNISISPPITPSGAFQTVDASPADSAAITVIGAANTVTPQGMAFHRDAFTLGCADLLLPGGVDMAARVQDDQLGLSIRLVRAYDINTDQLPCRLDILYGVAALRPELACRVAS